ncbi:MAG: hypothetical protein Q9205_005933, partial [Flavoplaca limonia]
DITYSSLPSRPKAITAIISHIKSTISITLKLHNLNLPMPSTDPFLTRRGDTALAWPQSPRQSNHNSHCTGTCAIVLAVVIPAVLLALVITLVLIMGENSYFGRRQQSKAEREAVKKKLGDEDSVGSGDSCSLDGGVYSLNGAGRTEAREKTLEGEQRGVGREEGHEHDHVLAMIGARP